MNRSVLGTVGSPLVQVESPPGSIIAAKVESRNPGGSAKDRPALAMIEAAERAGEIEPGDTIVEPTSGNTGIGIAMVAAARGYDAIIVMPGSKSPERQRIMRAYGARLELVDGDISDAKDYADELEETEDAVQLRQFENESNPRAHYETTGREILDQVEGRRIDALVAGVGTGGTISGIGRRLREAHPEMEIIAVEPEDSAVLSGREPEGDSFQGMGPGFISPNLDRDLLDDVETVTLDAAEEEARRLAREEGILVGQSSAASNIAAKRVAERLAADAEVPGPDTATNLLGGEPESPDSELPADAPLIVTVFWDSGERYMSTGMFD